VFMRMRREYDSLACTLYPANRIRAMCLHLLV
jgi:hypothetical protein